MRFQQLRYLDTAVRLGSLRRAAEAVGITQPSLTQQLRRLEEELNVVLLIRRSTGVVATDAATALLPHVRMALHAENALHQEASAISGLHSGQLSLATVPTAGRLFVSRTVRTFLDAYPRIRFEVTEGGSNRVRESILSGKADLGIIARWAEDEHSEELHVLDLLEGFCNLCVPVGHRLADLQSVSMSDLSGESFIVVEPGQILREAFDRIADAVDVRVVYQTTNSASAQATVEAGIGITLQSGFGSRHESRLSVSVPFAAPLEKVALSVIRRRDERPTPATIRFLKMLRAEARRQR